MDLDVWGTLSFRGLAHFVAIVEAGTISGAAEGLFMSQSAVAGSVTELERALEADLLIRRRGRGVTLTPTGAEVLGRARSLLAGAAELNDLAHGHGSELAGPLAVGCFVTLAPTVLPRLLVEFEARHAAGDDLVPRGARRTRCRSSCWPGSSTIAVMFDMDLTTSLTDSRRAVRATGVRALRRRSPVRGSAERDAGAAGAGAAHPVRAPTPSTSYAMSLFEGRGLQPNVRHRTHGYELTRSLVARNPRTTRSSCSCPRSSTSYRG